MDARQIIAKLNSDTEANLISAIYSVDESFSNNIEVILRLRQLVCHESCDVREISIMRLACRLGDGAIKSILEENVFREVDELTFSASVRGLVCLSFSSLKEREVLLSMLTTRLPEISSNERRKVINQAVEDLSKAR